MRVLNIPYRGKKKQFWNLWYWAKRCWIRDVALVSHRAEKNSSHAHKTGFWYFSGFFQNFWQVPHTFDVGVPQVLKAKVFLRKIWFWTVISSLMKSGGGLFKPKKNLCVFYGFLRAIFMELIGIILQVWFTFIVIINFLSVQQRGSQEIDYSICSRLFLLATAYYFSIQMWMLEEAIRV